MADQLYQLPMTIKLHSPVLIARTVGDENMVGSEDYIPGSVLLGAFAGMYINKNGKVDTSKANYTDFADLFLSESVRFLNGYPQLECKEDDKTEEKRALPVPLSIQYDKEKNASAVEKFFKCDKSGQDEGKNWKLITFDDLLKKSDEKNAAPVSKYKSGYCLLSENDSILFFQKTSVAKQYQIHHERTNQRVGRSADAEIYNYESIMPNQTFSALILGPKTKLEQLQVLLNENENIMRLGRSKHTQYGNASVNAGVIEKFHNEAQTLSTSHLLKENQFILTCTSDLVLLHDTQKVNLKTLQSQVAERLGITSDGLPSINAFFKTDMVEKYNAAWKARTPALPCFVKGSCFVFELTGKSLNDVSEKITEIQREGLGLHRNEGYGRVLINWQGLPIEKKDVLITLSPPKFAPETTLPLFQELIKNWLLELVQVGAADKVSKVTNKKIAINSTQINKLKRMAIDAKTFSVFKERLEQLNDNSKERLREQHFDGKRFYDFLTTEPFDIEKLISQKDKNENRSKLFDYADFHHYKNHSELHQALFVKYYDTLFTLLDKSLKKNTPNQGEQDK